MLADVYVLANGRTADLVERFLTRFLPRRKATADEYEVPQYAERPEVVFQDAAALVRLCEQRPGLEHAVYWNHVDPGGEPRSATSSSPRTAAWCWVYPPPGGRGRVPTTCWES